MSHISFFDCLIFVLVLVLFCSVFGLLQRYFASSETPCFYPSSTFPVLSTINSEFFTPLKGDKAWIEWPEKELYDNQNCWNIIPFFAFGCWVEDNCDRYTALANWLKMIPNLRLATLSRLSPKTSLHPHKGWGSHSNHVLRAHYGVKIPSLCYVQVDEEIRFHEQDEWMVFDDSKTHMAANLSDRDRIVLIVDIERPDCIPNGTSTVGDTSELEQMKKYLKYKE